MATLAERITTTFLARPGFVEGAGVEARPLAVACDRILTGPSGLHHIVVCIVDAERDDTKGFDPGREAAKAALAESGARHSGAPSGHRQSAILVVVEVRRAAIAEARARLHRYSNRFFDRDAIHAFVVDAATHQVVIATRFSRVVAIGWRKLIAVAVTPDRLPAARVL